MNKEVSEIWSEISVPAKGNLSFTKSERNVYLIKDDQSRVGLLLKDVDMSVGFRKFKNLIIDTKETQIVKLKGKTPETFRNNISIIANHTRYSKLLVNTLETLFSEFKKKDNYTSEDLKRALNKSKSLWDLDQSNQADIIGCHGEMSWLKESLLKCSNDDDIDYLIKGWEGEGKRDNIDFKYETSGICIEVKTTTLKERIHSFKGLEQVTIPSHYDSGFVLSCRIDVVDEGYTNKALHDDIKSILSARCISALQLFDSKIKLRGAACLDNEMNFNRNIDMSLYDFDEVPKPIIEEDSGVLDIEWRANLSLCLSEEKQKFIKIISNL
ncbi:PD-(D/E)XK motif protein [Crocinitomicaceae bacterium]|nr:PD-(D/E)XK motif protein [Crocinitomicaceae bacterium]